MHNTYEWSRSMPFPGVKYYAQRCGISQDTQLGIIFILFGTEFKNYSQLIVSVEKEISLYLLSYLLSQGQQLSSVRKNVVFLSLAIVVFLQLKNLVEIGMDVIGIISIPEEKKPHTVTRVGLESRRINECCTKIGRNIDVSTSHLKLENIYSTWSAICWLIVKLNKSINNKKKKQKALQKAYKNAYFSCFAGYRFSNILQIMYLVCRN